MKTSTLCLLLALAVTVVCAEPVNLNCFIDDTKISKVVDCVKEKASEEIAKKIDAARVGLQCPDIPCTLRKLCNKHHGRIPAHSTKAFYSNEDKAIIRGLFDTCRQLS
ncbi:uncharacterized protein LOC125946016 [Dermacentor silvarum]|uniref:uncharacterized protein LOC125946016 n=1 Tax=Dermacentor silvarum TaxID=543639 RepID=UPI002101BA4D|nr:uncharacterized protein LOC125946016 [Dermacentor silvarum]